MTELHKTLTYSALNRPLDSGGCHPIPIPVAVCPECGGILEAESIEWITETGEPTMDGINVYCQTEEQGNSFPHKNWQSDWQCVINAITDWCEAVEN